MNQPLSEYLRNKDIRNNSHYRISPEGVGYVLEDNKVLKESVVFERYPLGSKITLWNYNPKGQNPDGTRV